MIIIMIIKSIIVMIMATAMAIAKGCASAWQGLSLAPIMLEVESVAAQRTLG